jgi:hypothetical protein
MMFLGFLSGYFLGKYGLEWDHTSSLILSIIVGSGTMIGETILLVIRMNKMEDSKVYQTELQAQRSRDEMEILNNI